VNLASRLSSEAADGQILLSQRAFAAVEQGLHVEPAGEYELKGIAKPVSVYSLIDIRDKSLEGTAVIASSPGWTLANGRYVVQRTLGEGSQKVVYFVRDLSLDRDCALALVNSTNLQPEDRHRLQREGQAIARLGAHPNIVTVFDVGEDEGRPYIVYEHVAGGDLREELRAAGGSLPIGRALSVASGVAAALAVVHGHGIVHRDLKPGNILLGKDREAKLCDFGIALAVDRSRLTAAGIVVGTVAYMSPEQALGKETDARTDLYSLGALLYELVAGRPPFVGETMAAVTSQLLHQEPEPPSIHNPEIQPSLDSLIMQMIAKRPSERPESAAAVAAQLDAFLALINP
jgi:serine/threonine-protein kinase